MPRRLHSRAAAAGLAAMLLTRYASAAPVIAPPGDPAFNASLSNLAAGYQLQQDTFAALEFGLSLDVDITPSQVTTVQAFFAQTATTDFQTFAGMKPFAVVDAFDEYEDLGNFGGIASVGVAARLMALEAEGASTATIDAARSAAVRAAQAWHVYATIGGPGVIARGIQRTTPLDAATGPLPGSLPTLTPLKDNSGNPLPSPKAAVWRTPVASGYSGWIWLDDTSKDQVSGYALAAAWLWDALAFDPMVDPSIPAALASDLVVFAKALMQPAPELDGIDLCIRDADGRLTDFHDLNARQIIPTTVVPPDSSLQNGFNAAMALGVIRAAYHVSGDPIVGRYYYDELVQNRGYPALMSDAGLIFEGASTNYSNVNMLAISYALLARFETDKALRASYAASVESTFWSTGSSDDVSHVDQAWYDVVYGSMSASPTATIRQRVAGNLGGFPAPPAFYVDRVNCSPAAIDAGVCIGIDGVTSIPLSSQAAHAGSVAAVNIVPMAIRPYSDFEWRSDPHAVNGSAATNLLDPGGDFLAAYWLGRLVDLDDPALNITNHPRAPYVNPDGGGPDGGRDAGFNDAAIAHDAASPKDASRPKDATPMKDATRSAADADAAHTATTTSASCGCDVPGHAASGWGSSGQKRGIGASADGPAIAGMASLLAVVMRRRRRVRRETALARRFRGPGK